MENSRRRWYPVVVFHLFFAFFVYFYLWSHRRLKVVYFDLHEYAIRTIHQRWHPSKIKIVLWFIEFNSNYTKKVHSNSLANVVLLHWQPLFCVCVICQNKNTNMYAINGNKHKYYDKTTTHLIRFRTTVTYTLFNVVRKFKMDANCSFEYDSVYAVNWNDLLRNEITLGGEKKRQKL